VNDSVNTNNFVPIIKKRVLVKVKEKPILNPLPTLRLLDHDKTIDNPLTHVHADSDDDFVSTSFKRASKHPSIEG
jgi:hypothetical protein